MHDIGYQPSFVLWDIQFYDPKSVAAAKTVSFPPSYVALGGLPAELVDALPGAAADPQHHERRPRHIRSSPLSPGSASAPGRCGRSRRPTAAPTSRQQCILAKAGSHTDWDAGGLFPPNSTIPGKQTQSDCVLLVRLTPEGFVYDKKVTQPNRGPYNCDPRNLTAIQP